MRLTRGPRHAACAAHFSAAGPTPLLASRTSLAVSARAQLARCRWSRRGVGRKCARQRRRDPQPAAARRACRACTRAVTSSTTQAATAHVLMCARPLGAGGPSDDLDLEAASAVIRYLRHRGRAQVHAREPAGGTQLARRMSRHTWPPSRCSRAGATTDTMRADEVRARSSELPLRLEGCAQPAKGVDAGEDHLARWHTIGGQGNITDWC